MTSNRTSFLTALFGRFATDGLKYCVSRNAAEAFAAFGSDIDLVVAKNSVALAEAICREVADGYGYRLALRTRFTNLCLLFWCPEVDFVRIDIDHGIRWRIFPVISASELLRDRKREGDLFVPSAIGEARVLSAKVAWMGRVSDRYRDRLDSLWEELGSPPECDNDSDAIRTVRLAREGNPAVLRKWLIRRSVTNIAQWPTLAGAITEDILRVIRRCIRPPGILLRYQGGAPLDWTVLADKLQMALPAQKSCVLPIGSDIRKIFKSLFKGGLVVETCTDKHPPRAGGISWRISAAQNRISAYRPGDGRLYLAHESSGLMTSCEDTVGEAETRLASFIGEAMALGHSSSNAKEPGKFVVLVGLDGAGKTTFARNLCGILPGFPDNRRVSYFHWIPSLSGGSFPWPSFEETPRKTPRSGIIQSVASVLRLAKSLGSAWVSYLLVTRRRVRRGEVVISDRFIYNYWLDPVSLRYSGPAFLLALAARMMPKPDLVISLEADADTLRSRKKELTRAEIEEQTKRLRGLPLDGVTNIVLDAGQHPDQVVSQAIEKLNQSGGSSIS